MAKDIDISLPEGGEITVPAWSTEETQKQIYNVLKSMNGVDKETLKKLEKAQRSEDKNDQKQIDALKQLSKDLKEGMNGGFLGGLAAAAGAAGGVLGTLAKGTTVVVGGVAALGAGLTAAVAKTADFAMSYSDAIKPLVGSGIAFGKLGKQVDDSVLDLTRLGFSADDAAKMLNNTSTAFLRMGDQGLKEFTSTLNAAAKEGARFGMVQDEATEYLLTELEERARSGLVEKMNATQFAAMQYGILEDQIKASRRLGKSVDEIADIQKDALGDDRLVALRQSFSGDDSQNKMINELVANLSAIPGLSSTDIADIIAAEQTDRGMESTDAYERLTASLSQTPGALAAYTDSIGNSVQALIKDNQEGFDAAQAEFAKTTKSTGDVLQEIQDRANAGDERAKGQLILLYEIAPEMVGAAGTLSRFGEVASKQLGNIDGDAVVNQASEAAAKLQNDFADMAGAVSTQTTRAAQAMTEFVKTLNTTLNESKIKEGFIKLADETGDLAIKGIQYLNTQVKGVAEDFIKISKDLNDAFTQGGLFGEGGVSELISANLITPLANALIDGVISIFTNPAVIAGALTGLGALMLAMRVSLAGLPGIGTGGDPMLGGDGDSDKDGKDGKGKAKGSKFAGAGKRALGGALLSGALELKELYDDFGDINKDLEAGKITQSQANIDKSAETGEAAGGVMGAAGMAAAGAAAGSVIPIVGTAVGALIGGGIGWYLGRQGGRAMGEGLGEAVFTPEQEALEAELLKIEERLTGDINRRSRTQLETRKQLVQAELDLMRPIEQTQPINPNNIPIMVTPPEDTEATDTSTSPVSQDGTPTQEVLSNQNATSPTDDLLRTLISQNESSISALEAIAKYTKGTAGSIAEVSQR
jgi:hypothetical protein